MRQRVNSSLTLVVAVLCLAPACYGQTPRPRVGKSEAVRLVKVASLAGWKEAVSDAGRFRILFRGEPEVADEPTGRGFEMRGERVKWFALYHDFEVQVDDDDTTLTRKYKESIEAVAEKRGSKLLARNSVTLNGRPGVGFILLGPAGPGQRAKSYMRAFQVGSRLYTLAVDDYGDVTESAVVPAEVQTFFDSFTFWE
ncbi:MAG TPA: hypothetical protein VF297_09925 [Pyrinomonadaceae bacterium]